MSGSNTSTSARCPHGVIMPGYCAQCSGMLQPALPLIDNVVLQQMVRTQMEIARVAVVQAAALERIADILDAVYERDQMEGNR